MHTGKLCAPFTSTPAVAIPPTPPPLCRYLTVMIWMKLAFSESACAYKEWRGGRGRGGKGRAGAGRGEGRRFLPCGRFKGGGGRKEGLPFPFPFPFPFHIGTFEHAHAFRCLNVSFASFHLNGVWKTCSCRGPSRGRKDSIPGGSSTGILLSSGTLNCARHETESTSLAALRPVCQWKGCMIILGRALASSGTPS